MAWELVPDKHLAGLYKQAFADAKEANMLDNQAEDAYTHAFDAIQDSGDLICNSFRFAGPGQRTFRHRWVVVWWRLCRV